MIIKEIKGLKYPDEYFIKFFFKHKLYQKYNIKVLEFGCGNGNNLMLPLEYSEIDSTGGGGDRCRQRSSINPTCMR